MTLGPQELTRTPKVSIGLPVYNGDNYLAETLECLVNQTFGDFEIVVVDNASTDKTAEICRAFASRDDRIQYHCNEINIGAVRNYNKTFELSKAPYFTWVAHDDLYDAAYLERCVDVLEQSPDVVLAHSAMRMIDPAGKPMTFDRANNVYFDRELDLTLPPEPTDLGESARPEERVKNILFHMYWCTSVFGLIRRDVLARTSLHKDYYGSDKVLLVELALMGRFYHIREELFSKRCHPEMSYFKGTTERAEWINPDNRQAFAPLYLLKGYANAVLKYGDLTMRQRASCLFSVFLKLIRAGFWGRLLEFGPNHPIPLGRFRRRRISTAK